MITSTKIFSPLFRFDNHAGGNR